MVQRFRGAEAEAQAEAVKASGFDDFGEPSYLEGLTRLFEALDSDLPRGPAERQACFGAAVSALTARLHAQEGWNRNPDCLKAEIKRPVFVVGSPRTGTTALHHMLAGAAGWQGMESWLIKRPMTRPPRSEWAGHPAYRAAVAAYEARIRANPELRHIHHVRPEDVDECIGVTMQTLCSNALGSTMHIPTYDAWYRAQDHRPIFRRIADNLRLIGAVEPDRRWLLKNPSHLLHLAELMEVFPDCRIVHIHRDPVKSMPSFWNLLYILRRATDGAGNRPERLPDRDLEPWRAALVRSIELSRLHPDRILDVYEDDLVGRPLATAARIFDFVDEPFTGDSERALGEWLAANPKGGHGVHRPRPEDFGTTAEAIAERFGDYRAHHGFGARKAPAEVLRPGGG